MIQDLCCSCWHLSLSPSDMLGCLQDTTVPLLPIEFFTVVMIVVVKWGKSLNMLGILRVLGRYDQSRQSVKKANGSPKLFQTEPTTLSLSLSLSPILFLSQWWQTRSCWEEVLLFIQPTWKIKFFCLMESVGQNIGSLIQSIGYRMIWAITI